MKTTEHPTTRVRRKPSEKDIILKLLLLLAQYKKDPRSVKKIFSYIRRLKKHSAVSISPELQSEIQELETLEEAIDTGKITMDNQHIVNTAVKDSIAVLKEYERSLRKNKR
jgi:hypothetical protein